MILRNPRPADNLMCLDARIADARAMLGRCTMCEWRCEADRAVNTNTPCRLGCETRVFNRYVSLTEEAEVVPALRVYLAGCNFRCRFCDTAPECFDAQRGPRVEAAAFAAELTAAVRGGVRSISVLGGEPTLHVHTLLEIAAAAPQSLPLVINTNVYMTPEVLDLLDGVVSLYLADLKFGNDACARLVAGVPHYVDVVHRNLLRIWGRTPVLVRHLLMPGHLACCFRPAVDWLTVSLPGVRFQLYSGYVPCWQAAGDERLGRLNRRDEVREAVEYLKASNLDWSADGDGTVQCSVRRAAV